MTNIGDLTIRSGFKLICDICGEEVSLKRAKQEGECLNCGVEWNESEASHDDVPAIRLYRV